MNPQDVDEDVADPAEDLLHVIAVDPETQHIPQQVEPAPVQEHRRQERPTDRDRARVVLDVISDDLPTHTTERVAHQDLDEVGHRLLQVLVVRDLPGRHRQRKGELLAALLLDQEDRDVGRDQDVGDDRQGPGALQVAEREDHGRSSPSGEWGVE